MNIEVFDSYSYDNWLFSLNVLFGVFDEFQICFGVLWVMCCFDFGLMKSNFVIVWGDDDFVIGVWLGLQVLMGNVQFDLILVDQFDLVFEWYFVEVGLLIFLFFYKSLDNYIVLAVIQCDIENNGQIFIVDIDGVGNVFESGEIQGFEVVY